MEDTVNVSAAETGAVETMGVSCHMPDLLSHTGLLLCLSLLGLACGMTLLDTSFLLSHVSSTPLLKLNCF